MNEYGSMYTEADSPSASRREMRREMRRKWQPEDGGEEEEAGLSTVLPSIDLLEESGVADDGNPNDPVKECSHHREAFRRQKEMEMSRRNKYLLSTPSPARLIWEELQEEVDEKELQAEMAEFPPGAAKQLKRALVASKGMGSDTNSAVKPTSVSRGVPLSQPRSGRSSGIVLGAASISATSNGSPRSSRKAPLSNPSKPEVLTSSQKDIAISEHKGRMMAAATGSPRAAAQLLKETALAEPQRTRLFFEDPDNSDPLRKVTTRNSGPGGIPTADCRTNDDVAISPSKGGHTPMMVGKALAEDKEHLGAFRTHGNDAIDLEGAVQNTARRGAPPSLRPGVEADEKDPLLDPTQDGETADVGPSRTVTLHLEDVPIEAVYSPPKRREVEDTIEEDVDCLTVTEETSPKRRTRTHAESPIPEHIEANVPSSTGADSPTLENYVPLGLRDKKPVSRSGATREPLPWAELSGSTPTASGLVGNTATTCAPPGGTNADDEMAVADDASDGMDLVPGGTGDPLEATFGEDDHLREGFGLPPAETRVPILLHHTKVALLYDAKIQNNVAFEMERRRIVWREALKSKSIDHWQDLDPCDWENFLPAELDGIHDSEGATIVYDISAEDADAYRISQKQQLKQQAAKPTRPGAVLGDFTSASPTSTEAISEEDDGTESDEDCGEEEEPEEDEEDQDDQDSVEEEDEEDEEENEDDDN